MENSFLFLNIIFLDFYTLRPTLFQFCYPLGTVESFKAFKILIDIGDKLLIRRKSLFTQPDLNIWK